MPTVQQHPSEADSPASRAEDRLSLSELDEEIERLQTRLSVLQEQRQAVHRRLMAYKYPILTLPNEIAIEIFQRYLWRHAPFQPIYGDGSPTLLSHVCHRWRRILLDWPGWWQAMQVLGGTPAHLLRVWLDRSADLPLEVNLSFREGGSFAAHAILMTQAIRWQHTELVLQSIPRLFRGKTLEMPLLTYFGFVDLYHNNVWGFDDEDSDSDDNHTDENDPDDTIIPIRFSAPNLQTLFYASVDFLRASIQISPSTWANIVNLMLYQVDVDSALAILETTKRLRNLHIEELTFDEEDSHPSRRVKLPSLKTLIIRNPLHGSSAYPFADAHNGTEFPMSIVAEALQNLALSEGLLVRSGPNDSETKPEVETLADLLRSWGCAPRIVHITGVDDTRTKEYYQDSGLPLAVDCEMHVRAEDAALDEPAMPESLWRTWSGVKVNGRFWYL